MRRLIVLALPASVAVHAAVLGWMPRFVFDDYELTKVGAMEVVRLKAEPLPVAEPEHARAPLPEAQQRRREPKRRPARAPARAQPAPRPETHARTVMARPEPRPATETSPTVARPETARVPSPPPEPPSEVAAAALTPPGFGAAYLRNPLPRYPLAARRAGEQGTVTLKVLVSREGLPAHVDVEKTSGSNLLDEAALETVRTWRFIPARQGTEPIESWVLVPIVFRLEGVS